MTLGQHHKIKAAIGLCHTLQDSQFNMYINNDTAWLTRVQGKTQMAATTHTLIYHQASSATWQDEDNVIRQKMECHLAAHGIEGRSCV